MSQAPQSAVLPLFVLLLLAGCDDAPPVEKNVVRPVIAMRVADAPQFRQRSLPGRAEAKQEVALSFRVSGPLIERPVDVGTEVKTGDLVARIDPRDFEVALNNVQGQLDQALATFQRAESDYDRLQRVYQQDPGATSEAAIDKARQARDSAAASVRSLKASVASAKDQLSYTYLKAPFDGTVVVTYVENFEDVLAKQPVVRVVDDSGIEVTVSVPESLISMAPMAQNIQVVFDAFPDRPIPAEIKEIGTEASETTRTYPVTIKMNQPDDVKILPGMAGKVTAEPPSDSELAGVLEVPVAATYSPEGNEKTFVWVIDESSNTVSQREVKPGELTDTGIRIVEGLKPGEWIATAGVHYLREGQSVKILERSTE